MKVQGQSRPYPGFHHDLFVVCLFGHWGVLGGHQEVGQREVPMHRARQRARRGQRLHRGQGASGFRGLDLARRGAARFLERRLLLGVKGSSLKRALCVAFCCVIYIYKQGKTQRFCKFFKTRSDDFISVSRRSTLGLDRFGGKKIELCLTPHRKGGYCRKVISQTWKAGSN